MAPLKTLDPHCLAPESRELLSGLAGQDWGADFYLAGSAALALYLGHRPVRDLDLMSQVRRLRSSERRDLLQDLLRIDPDLRIETARNGLLYVRSESGTAIRLYYYPYPLVDAEEFWDELAVASPVDLGLMKLGAIISRGSRRDFVDLYLLCREIPLSRVFERSAEKFGHVGDFPLQALKGMADLSQIDGEPMPRLSASISWNEVRDWLEQQVASLGRSYVGLE